MRVLLSTPDFPPEIGGIQLLLCRLVQHSRHDYRVMTLASKQVGSDPSGIDIRRLPRISDHRAAVGALNVETVRELVRWRPDVLISGHIVLAPSCWLVARRTGVPIVQYLYSDELRARERMARLAIRSASHSIAISRHTVAQAARLGAPRTRVSLVAPGVDLPKGVLDPHAREKSPPTILTVARLADRYKGFDVVLRALPIVRARIPGVRWTVIGDGPLRRQLEETARRWGLRAACTFLGRTSDSVRDSWFERAHVFALPSRITSDRGGSEGFGIAYLEAGARYLPSVAGRGSGAEDAVAHGRSGLLVNPHDHVDVAEAIVSLLLDRRRAQAMGRAARQIAEAHSWARMAASVDAELTRLVNDGTR